LQGNFSEYRSMSEQQTGIHYTASNSTEFCIVLFPFGKDSHCLIHHSFASKPDIGYNMLLT